MFLRGEKEDFYFTSYPDVDIHCTFPRKLKNTGTWAYVCIKYSTKVSVKGQSVHLSGRMRGHCCFFLPLLRLPLLYGKPGNGCLYNSLLQQSPVDLGDGTENGPNKIFCNCSKCWRCILLNGTAPCVSHICFHQKNSGCIPCKSLMAKFEESTYYVVSGILSRGRVAWAESSHLSSNLLCLLAPMDETRLSMWMLIMASVFPFEGSMTCFSCSHSFQMGKSKVV